MWGDLQVRCPGELPIRPLDGRRTPVGECRANRAELARTIGKVAVPAMLVAIAIWVMRRRNLRRERLAP